MSYLDKTVQFEFKARVYQWVCVFLGVIILILSGVQIFSYRMYLRSQTTQQVVLSPAISSFEIATTNSVPISYIKGAYEHVVYLNASWTYESIADNFNNLYESYYSADLETRVKGSLLATRRFEKAKENKMISTFRIDPAQSSYQWCDALNMTCGIVSGTETVYINHNNVFSSKRVSYLIFAKTVFPTKSNPFALSIERVVVGDYETLIRSLDAAKKGELPDEIR